MDGLRASDCACTKSELQLFEGRNVQTVVEKGQWMDVYPMNNISANTPIEFIINGSPDEYIDLNDTMLQLKVNVTNADGSALVGTDLVSPINNMMHSLFEDVILTMQDTIVEGGSAMYPYKAYLINLLQNNKLTKTGQMKAQGWYKDEGNKFQDATGLGVIARAKWTNIELCGPLRLDLFQQSKYLLNNTDIKIKFIRSKDSFAFTSLKSSDAITGFKTKITSAVLYVRRVKVAPSIILENEATLATKNAIYPIQHTRLQTYVIPAGTRSSSREGLYRGMMPKVVIVGLVSNASFNGSLSTNPFNFQHFNVNSIALYKEGESIPCKPYTPNYADVGGSHTREYLSLHQALEYYNQDASFDLGLDEYKNGYCLYAFNLCPDMAISGHGQPSRTGNLRLEIGFSTATTESINTICMGIFDGQIEIGKTRQVFTDYK